MKRIFNRLAAAMLIAVCGVLSLTSCGGSDDLASVIPANVKYAVKIDLTQFITNCGGTVSENGEVDIPQLSQVNGSMAVMAKTMLSTLNTIDLSSLIVFETDDTDDIVFVTGMRNADDVKKKLESYLGKGIEEDGYMVYRLGGLVVATKGDMLYAAEKFDHITEAVKEAKKSTIGTLPAVSEWINADVAVSVIINADEADMPDELKAYWLCGKMALDGPSVTGEIVLMDKDGKRYEFGNAFDEVSTDFLAYIPDDSQSVLALGEVVSPQIKSMLNRFTAQMGECGKFFRDIDGTVSFALGINPQVDWSEKLMSVNMNVNRILQTINPGDIGLTAMIHYPQATVDDMVNMLDDQARMSGQIPVVNIDGLHEIKFYGLNLTYGSVNGYFAISTEGLRGNSETEFAPLVEGTRAVMASIQQPGDNMLGLTWGSKGRIWLTKDAIKGEVTLTNTSLNFMEAVGQMFNSPQFKQMVEQMVSSAYGQEMYAYYEDGPDDSFGGFDEDADYTM